jgi:UDP-N-acetylmuramyl pentapeptide synthase
MNAEAPKLNPALPEREITSFAIDSRDVKAGDVFFALSQPDYKNNGFNGDFDDATPFVRRLSKKVRSRASFVATDSKSIVRF